MKTNLFPARPACRVAHLTAACLWLAACYSSARAQGTAFTYQGRLEAEGRLAGGLYDLTFALHHTSTGGGALAGPLTNSAVDIRGGLFTVTLDFGGNFSGEERWLEIGVRTNGGAAFQTLSPRQPIHSAPYAIRAGSAGSVQATNITGTLPPTALPSGVLLQDAAGVSLSGRFTGDGGGLTNVLQDTLARSSITSTSIISWGSNSLGQTNVPAGLDAALAVAGGGFHSLALKHDGTVVAWGNNGNGQASIPSGLSNVVAVAGGGQHSLALKRDGTVVAWGFNFYGQTNVPLAASNVIAVAGGGSHSLALRQGGTVVGWGNNQQGQTTVASHLNEVVAVAAGENHSLALKSDGTVSAWGQNTYGQTNVPGGLADVASVACGGYHSLALKSDGTVVAWGFNSSGQTVVPAGLSNVVAVAAGITHSLALRADGRVIAWGFNGAGQTGTPASFSNITALASGGTMRHGLALKKSVDRTETFDANVRVTGLLTGDGGGLTNLIVSTPGSYLPVVGNGVNVFICGAQQGHFTKIGNLVYVEIRVVWTSRDEASTGPLTLSLPLTPVSTRPVFDVGYVNGVTHNYPLVALGNDGTMSVNFYERPPSGQSSTPISTANCRDTGELLITGWYRWQ